MTIFRRKHVNLEKKYRNGYKQNIKSFSLTLFVIKPLFGLPLHLYFILPLPTRY